MQDKGLMIDVYRAGGYRDCTNGGVSAKDNRVVMVSDEYEVSEIFETEGRGILKLITRDVGFAKFPILVPLDAKKNGDPYMFGGNFGWSGDSRFPVDTPVKIFDRRE